MNKGLGKANLIPESFRGDNGTKLGVRLGACECYSNTCISSHIFLFVSKSKVNFG